VEGHVTSLALTHRANISMKHIQNTHVITLEENIFDCFADHKQSDLKPDIITDLLFLYRKGIHEIYLPLHSCLNRSNYNERADSKEHRVYYGRDLLMSAHPVLGGLGMNPFEAEL